MAKYVASRLLMMLPTLFGITLLSFVIINLAPGGPIEQKLQQMRFGAAMGAGGGAGGASTGGRSSERGVPTEILEALKKQYGFDKPLYQRYFIWIKNLVTLDFGKSFTYEEPVLKVIVSKFPVSIMFGVVSLFLTYLICIPLGIAKAVREGSGFDSLTSFVLFVMYSVMPLVLGLLAITFLANESFLDWFPVQGIYSDDYDQYTLWGKFLDRVHHMVLPLCCYMIGNFTVLTLMMKNSLLDEIRSDYVRTARAKGLEEKIVVYKHALRNALIPIVTGLASFMSFFLAGSVIIEKLFGLDGMGLLFYESALSRDYNVMMALTVISSFLMLFGRLVSDLLYVVVDPRIDFS